jgi:hypothetical protein
MLQKDLGELNQCQSTLRHLYDHNIPGHPEEFLAYRILYMLHTRNKSGPSTSQVLLRLALADRRSPFLRQNSTSYSLT